MHTVKKRMAYTNYYKIKIVTLGFIRYFWESIQDFSSIAELLHKITCKGEWSIWKKNNFKLFFNELEHIMVFIPIFEVYNSEVNPQKELYNQC